MQNYLFDYDNICLRPKYSELESRSKADTSIDFLGRKFRLPVIPSNMQDVISWDLANGLALNDYCYVMHRFDNALSKIPDYIVEFSKLKSISIGVNDDTKQELDEFWDKYEYESIDFMCIDVAHGHHKKVEDMLNYIRDIYDGGYKLPKIIAGNVATADGYKYLCDLGVDAVKVGIGGGSICSTRYKTGFHLPTAYSVYECAQAGRDIPIIADGGAKHFGDVAKALVLGAAMVMSGRWFAECIDSPAKIKDGKKIYRGSTSFESKGHKNHIEGKTLELNEGISYSERLEEITQALQSSISYAGGKNLLAFNSVEWEILS